jgi:hypothetical protein
VNDRSVGLRRHVRAQPLPHRLDVGLLAETRKLPELMHPAQLPLEVAGRLAEARKIHRRIVDAVERHERIYELIAHARAVVERRKRVGQRVPYHDTVDALHQVERCTDHSLVFTQQNRAWDGYRRAVVVERAHHAILARDVERRRWKVAARRPPEHDFPAVAGDEERQTRLPFPDPFDVEAAGVLRLFGREELRQRLGIDELCRHAPPSM